MKSFDFYLNFYLFLIAFFFIKTILWCQIHLSLYKELILISEVNKCNLLIISVFKMSQFLWLLLQLILKLTREFIFIILQNIWIQLIIYRLCLKYHFIVIDNLLFWSYIGSFLTVLRFIDHGIAAFLTFVLAFIWFLVIILGLFLRYLYQQVFECLFNLQKLLQNHGIQLLSFKIQ